MYYVYIIHSIKLNKHYIGYTEDLRRRIKEHNNGKSQFTSKDDSWQLIYYSAFIEKEDAKNEERFLKTGQGRQRRKMLLSKFNKNIQNGKVAERLKAAHC